MRRILLVNPNTSCATTAMMVAVASKAAPAGIEIVGATAQSGSPMIVDRESLLAAVPEVVRLGGHHAPDVSGIIVGAFADPGVAELRARMRLPVIGLGEASLRKAAAGGRRFGVVTIAPQLVASVDDLVRRHGFGALYTGSRVPSGDPRQLAVEAKVLEDALAVLTELCFARDGAEAVIIGGGPTSDAAAALARRFDKPVIAPLPAAVAAVLAV